MELAKVKARIEKLQRMAKVIGPEAENAKRLIQNLIEKYELNPEEFSEERKPYEFKAHRLKKYAMRLASFCKVPVYSLRGRPDYIQISANALEYKMYYELYVDIKLTFNSKENELRKLHGNTKYKNIALKSFMMGYMESNYPFDNRLCTSCGEGRVVETKFGLMCDNCYVQYKTSKFHNTGIMGDYFEDGRNTTAKKIQAEKLRIGSD
jgi:hypothetical protein